MSSQLPKKYPRSHIQNSDPGKILDLVSSLYDDNCAMLEVKINNYFMEECEAELAFMIIIYGERMEAFIDAIGINMLARKTKIMMNSKMVEMMRTQFDATELLTNLADDIQKIVKPYVPKDPKDPNAKKRFLLTPRVDMPFSVIMCIMAPKPTFETVINFVNEAFLFVWPTLKKSIWYEYEFSMKQKCQQLLKVARRLFTQVASLDILLQIAMEQAKSLTKSEYCCVKLVDLDRMELVEHTFHGGKMGTGDNKVEGEKRRFPLDKGIVGQVINSGNLINCKVAKDHPFFNKDIDTLPGVNCKSLLCFPIREQTGILGVGQLFNKIGDPYFDGIDEEMALAFSIYCGVCIMHSVVYRKIQEAHIRNALANELVMYHMKVTHEEVKRVLDCNAFHGHPHVSSLHFNIRSISVKEFPCYALKFFKDLGFIEKFNLKPFKLVRFVLHAKKGYRDVPYHNWTHAFSVAQWAYAAMLNFKLVSLGYFTDLQALMFLVAGLVHDLDHRGTTNSFHLEGQTTLAALYSSEGSVMERHHLAQAMCILNTEGCDILESLPRRDYDRAIIMLRDYILASDLANYFKNKQEYSIIANEYQKANRVHSAALQALLMNAADLSDQLKDWDCIKKTAAAVLTEFFKQGDVEKARGNLPDVTMDRDKCFIPELEIQFLSTTCIPIFETLGNILPRVNACTKILENHVERWEAAKTVFHEVPIAAGLSVLLSPELDHLIELSMIEQERLAKEAEEQARLEAAEAARKAAQEAADE